ncbi:hypothetical protein SCP_0206280 [Sparassis crispa]|uniref:Uncharacterized protein n=1 Tax=Sparassis crispa TaxID=139825 RepID=A0A401GB77_9APHY|nr:hypothetical protein SCP_0206280 [Sparassis crispa]GBE79430.1 hypothetical protein SCP_0206280 [Sparassis crispa]
MYPMPTQEIFRLSCTDQHLVHTAAAKLYDGIHSNDDTDKNRFLAHAENPKVATVSDSSIVKNMPRMPDHALLPLPLSVQANLSNNSSADFATPASTMLLVAEESNALLASQQCSVMPVFATIASDTVIETFSGAPDTADTVVAPADRFAQPVESTISDSSLHFDLVGHADSTTGFAASSPAVFVDSNESKPAPFVSPERGDSAGSDQSEERRSLSVYFPPFTDELQANSELSSNQTTLFSSPVRNETSTTSDNDLNCNSLSLPPLPENTLATVLFAPADSSATFPATVLIDSKECTLVPSESSEQDVSAAANLQCAPILRGFDQPDELESLSVVSIPHIGRSSSESSLTHTIDPSSALPSENPTPSSDEDLDCPAPSPSNLLSENTLVPISDAPLVQATVPDATLVDSANSTRSTTVTASTDHAFQSIPDVEMNSDLTPSEPTSALITGASEALNPAHATREEIPVGGTKMVEPGLPLDSPALSPVNSSLVAVSPPHVLEPLAASRIYLQGDPRSVALHQPSSEDRAYTDSRDALAGRIFVSDDRFSQEDVDMLELPASSPAASHSSSTRSSIEIVAFLPTAHEGRPSGGDSQIRMQVDENSDLPSSQRSQYEPNHRLEDIALQEVLHSSPQSSPPLPPSSPFRSSSPCHIFSSSPSRDVGNTPPSSPPPTSWSESDEKPNGDSTGEIADESCLGKRARSAVEETSMEYQDDHDMAMDAALEEREVDVKRMKPDVHLSPPRPPNPKRLTFASQQKQRKKLAAPFRSPLVDKATTLQGLHAVCARGMTSRDPGAETITVDTSSSQLERAQMSQAAAAASSTKSRDYTENAAKQFRSPFSTSTAAPTYPSTSTVSFSSVKATPTIQVLQAKVQTLKQAIKFKNGSAQEDDNLEALVRKWRNVGREVAWAVWDTVKDVDPTENMTAVKGKNSWFEDEYHGAPKGKGGLNGSWGYDTGKKGRSCAFEAGWGWDGDKTGTTADSEMIDGDREKGAGGEDEDEAAAEHTLGTMLRHFGIAPETLGWDEDEGDFIGDV